MAVSSRTFGKYRLVAELGHGGMANVFLAASTGPASVTKLLVLKQIRPEMAGDPAFVEMFLDEARLAARVNHPNVVQTLEVGEASGHYYLAMEFLDGQPLSRIQGREAAEQLTLSQRLRILVDALGGLHHAHELRHYDGSSLGVVHRDATPQNIFVTYDGQVKVVDFGVAKAATSSGQTSAGVIKGKLSYMAPEQARGEPIDRRADVFSVGVMFWEAVVGRRMWGRLSSEMGILHRLAIGEIPPLPASVPDELRAIGARALAPDAADRYPTAAAMAEDLDRYLEGQADRGSPREIGARLVQVFGAERERLQLTVNEQLAAIELAATGTHLSLPHLEHDAAATVDALPPSFPEVPEVTSYTAQPAASSLPPAAPLPPPGAAPSARRPALVAGLVAVVATVAVLGLWRGLSSREAVAPAASAAAAAPRAEIRVAVRPESARLFFDDEPLASNPATVQCAIDGRTHLVRAEAPGHLPRVRSLVVDRDHSLEFTLDLDPAAAPVAARPVAGPVAATAVAVPFAATAVSPTAAPAGATTAGKKPGKGRRTVDPDNPYAQ